MKKLTLALMAATSLASVAYAAQVPADTKLLSPDQQVVVTSVRENPVTFDPNNLEFGLDLELADQQFEGLTTYDAQGNVVPGQAESWTTNEDKSVWTFKLRPGLKWSDGEPLTARDFVTSWRRLVDPKNGFLYSFYQGDLQVKNAQAVAAGKVPVDQLGVRAVDDLTLEVTLEGPVPWFLVGTVMPHLGPVPTHLLAAGKKWPDPNNMVVNGPFRLTKYVNNEYYEFVPNPSYWDHQHTVLTKLRYEVVPQDNAAFQRFQAKEVNVVELPLPSLVQTVKKSVAEGKPWAFHSQPSTRVTMFSFWVNDGPFANKDVRQAVTYALHPQDLEQRVLKDSVVATSLLTYKFPGFAGLKEAQYWDLPRQQREETARQLLAKAGYNKDNPLRFTYGFNQGDANRRVAVALQGQLRDVFGDAVEVKLEAVETKSYTPNRRAGKYGLSRQGWDADFREPVNYYSILTANSPVNVPKWNNPEYNATYAQLFKAATTEQRLPLYQKLNDLVAEDFAAVVAYRNVEAYATDKRVRGFNTNAVVRRYQEVYLVDDSK